MLERVTVSCHRLPTAALPTVYRRWGSKPELIRQAVTGAAGTQLRVPDAGSVDTDLRMLAPAVQVELSAPEIAGVMRQFWAGRLDAVSAIVDRAIVDRAIERGELPAGTDPAAFKHAMSAPLYCRLLVTCEPVTERDADLGAAAALAAAQAGVLRTPPDSAG